uniref:Uncharacterized protein n=1 Tax=Clytia hemisphaerica TaxID=252671 RepID=A0A7M5XFF6_9CNID|eukprot:TCONS_00062137-protein
MMASSWSTLFVFLSIMLMMSETNRYQSSPYSGYPVRRSYRGFYHHTGCRMKKITLNLTHSLCSKPNVLTWYGCEGYCHSKSTAQYTPSMGDIEGIDNRCKCCKATAFIHLSIHVCAHPRSQMMVPVPMGCTCQPCHDFYKK